MSIFPRWLAPLIPGSLSLETFRGRRVPAEGGVGGEGGMPEGKRKLTSLWRPRVSGLQPVSSAMMFLKDNVLYEC